ncbi:hypothetical protein AURDEDRAFT_188617 [Auricularia subglabra TFB-10046 SS5]|nr:hypothetical protein AURDEDRAFT_188617 [Auricularia subglabra TFB-10046 SS5]
MKDSFSQHYLPRRLVPPRSDSDAQGSTNGAVAGISVAIVVFALLLSYFLFRRRIADGIPPEPCIMPQDRIPPEREDLIIPFPPARTRRVTFAPAPRPTQPSGNQTSAAPLPPELPCLQERDAGALPESQAVRRPVVDGLPAPPSALLPQASTSQLTEEIIRLREALARMQEENELLKQSVEPAPPYSSESRSVVSDRFSDRG